MLSSPAETAAFLLDDLDRWSFGQLLAERARWPLADPEPLNAAVRTYRLAILLAVLKAAGPEHQPLMSAIEAKRALDAAEHAPYDAQHEAWESTLAERFLQRLQSLAPLQEAEAPLTRFAHGQYFKYSRRIAYLLKLPAVLPCLYAPSAVQAA